ncbi:hypothetical protein BKA64DRAFT_71436 [Cadophora sp. MPI-SDFR-AT-0126]|nr:hypothetical protein BKA64DRAFT_71436 [Leotiomycetes sp. MPI-SDFR-AT-0126]
MNKCTNPSGSSTAKWLATVTRSHPTGITCFLGLQTPWKLCGACQSRELSSTKQQASQSGILKDGDGLLVNSTTGSVKLSGNVAAARNGASRNETFEASNPQSSSNALDPTSTSNVSAAESPIGFPQEFSKPAFKRRPLSLSPLMDPSFLEAREKHRAQKSLPSKNPTKFQQQLAKNPYALALATPVRRCSISGTKLPSFFLQGFRVMSDPTTGEPWYVPANLAKKHLSTEKREAVDKVEEAELGKLDELDSGMGKDSSAKVAELVRVEEQESRMEAEAKARPSKMGYQGYTLNSKVLIGGMVDTASGSKRSNKGKAGQAKFIPGGWRPVKSAMQTYGKAGWRPDMDDFVTILMGRRISEALLYLARKKRGYIVGCTDWEDALKKSQVAAFLWTGSLNGDMSTGPPEFATLDVGTQDIGDVGPQLAKKKRKVPIYNLPALLGKEKLEELRKSVPNSVFEKEVVVLKHKNVTVEVQSRLWKLQGYMAEYHDDQATRFESDMEEAQGNEVTDISEDLEPLH